MTHVATETLRKQILKRNAEVLALFLCKHTHGVMEVFALQQLPYNNHPHTISLLLTVHKMFYQTYQETLTAGITYNHFLDYQNVRRVAAGKALGSSLWSAIDATTEMTRRENLSDELDLLLLPQNWQRPETWPQLTCELQLPIGYLEKARKTARRLNARRPSQEQWRL
jgi:hypothetical protein